MKKEKLIGYLIGWIASALVFYWYNYVWYINRFKFWQWMILAIVWLWIAHSIKKVPYWIATVVFFTSVVLQILSWFGTIKLPIIK